MGTLDELADADAARRDTAGCFGPALVLHSLTFPAFVGPFVRGEVKGNEAVAPGAGHTIAYHHHGSGNGRPGDADFPATVTAYLYPDSAMPEPEGGREAALLREARRCFGEILAAVDAGVYAAARYEGHAWTEVGDAARLLVVWATILPPGARPGEERHAAICLTWVGGRFLKVRVTSAAEEGTRAHAFGVAGTLGKALGLAAWDDDRARTSTRPDAPGEPPARSQRRENHRLVDPVLDLYEVLGTVTLRLAGHQDWFAEDFQAGRAFGTVFTMRERGGAAEPASLTVVDTTDDPTEPWITNVARADVPALDDRFRRDVTAAYAARDRGIAVEWMSSHLNETEHLRCLVTAYMVHEGDGARQIVAARIQHGGRKLVLEGGFDTAEAGTAGRRILQAMREAGLRAPMH